MLLVEMPAYDSRVQNAFTLKELQQFFNALLDTNDRSMLQVQLPTAQISNYQVNR